MDENPMNNDSYRAFKRTQRVVRPLALGILFGLAGFVLIVLLTDNWLIALLTLAIGVVVGFLSSASRSISALQKADPTSQEPEK